MGNFILGVCCCLFVMLVFIINLEEIKLRVEKRITNHYQLIARICFSILLGLIISMFLIFVEGKNKSNNPFKVFEALSSLLGVVVASVSIVIAIRTSKDTAKINLDVKNETIFYNQLSLLSKVIDKLDQRPYSALVKSVYKYFKSDSFFYHRGTNFVKRYFAAYDKEVLKILEGVSDLDVPETSSKTIDKSVAFYEDAIRRKQKKKLRRIWFTVHENIHNQYKNLYILPAKSKKNILDDDFTGYLFSHDMIYRDMIHKYVFEWNVLNGTSTFKEMSVGIENYFYKSEGDINQFFRSFHRVVKFINDTSTITSKKKKNYFGILRSQLSEELMLILYYNCVYTSKGLGLCKLLIGSDFFGDENDFKYYISPNDKSSKMNFSEAQHFSENTFLLPDKDIFIIINLFTKKLPKSEIDTLKAMEDADVISYIAELYQKNSRIGLKKRV